MDLFDQGHNYEANKYSSDPLQTPLDGNSLADKSISFTQNSFDKKLESLVMDLQGFDRANDINSDISKDIRQKIAFNELKKIVNNPEVIDRLLVIIEKGGDSNWWSIDSEQDYRKNFLGVDHAVQEKALCVLRSVQDPSLIWNINFRLAVRELSTFISDDLFQPDEVFDYDKVKDSQLRAKRFLRDNNENPLVVKKLLESDLKYRDPYCLKEIMSGSTDPIYIAEMKDVLEAYVNRSLKFKSYHWIYDLSKVDYDSDPELKDLLLDLLVNFESTPFSSQFPKIFADDYTEDVSKSLCVSLTRIPKSRRCLNEPNLQRSVSSDVLSSRIEKDQVSLELLSPIVGNSRWKAAKRIAEFDSNSTLTRYFVACTLWLDRSPASAFNLIQLHVAHVLSAVNPRAKLKINSIKAASNNSALKRFALKCLPSLVPDNNI